MFKIVLTIKKKKGLSLQAFMDHYDKVHIPLAQKILPPAYMSRRNYILTEHPFYAYVGDDRATSSAEPPFDVITETYYETEEDARRCMDAFFNGETRRQMMEDEAHFCEPGGVNFYVVRVSQTAIPWGSNVC